MKRFLVAVLAAALCAGISAQAQTYPAKAVRIIVPFAAGGPADIYARFIGQRLSEALAHPFVIENRPGAGSVIGTDAVAKSQADGYTLLMMSNTHTVNESLIPNKPFDLMRDFAPVAPINYSDLVLVVHPLVKANNLKELIALAKANPKGMTDVKEFQKTMDSFSAPNPYMVGDAKLKYVGSTSFGQKRQVSVPLVVNVYKDGKFETMFVASVD